MQPRKIIPLIVAVSLIMQQLDSTAIATALPSMASSLNDTPLHMHLAITSYLLSLAAFLPVSSWVADKFGARRVFRWAIAIFIIASALCGFAQNLPILVLSRVAQGFGGAMMLPVGRLILVKSVPKSELVAAMALMGMPTIVGPVLGPVFGGFITTYASWRYIFWINVPVGLIGIVLVGMFIPDIREEEAARAFDWRGFFLSGIGLAGTLYGVDAAGTATGWDPTGVAWLVVGLVALILYFFHARAAENPILDLRLMRFPTFRASVLGGSLFRIGMGAFPFLLPLMMQEGFGYLPFQSGLLTFCSALGAFGMRQLARFILRRFGFRTVLVWNSTIACVSIAVCGLFRPETPIIVMVVIIFLGGVFRALQFTSINAIAFSDVESRQMSQATSFTQMAQRLSMSFGVAIAAFVLHQTSGGGGQLPLSSFMAAWLVVAAFSATSILSFAQLDVDAGSELSGTSRRSKRTEGQTAAAEESAVHGKIPAK